MGTAVYILGASQTDFSRNSAGVGERTGLGGRGEVAVGGERSEPNRLALVWGSLRNRLFFQSRPRNWNLFYRQNSNLTRVKMISTGLRNWMTWSMRIPCREVNTTKYTRSTTIKSWRTPRRNTTRFQGKCAKRSCDYTEHWRTFHVWI